MANCMEPSMVVCITEMFLIQSRAGGATQAAQAIAWTVFGLQGDHLAFV